MRAYEVRGSLTAVERPGVERPGVERPGVAGPGVERPGVERPGMERRRSSAEEKQSLVQDSSETVVKRLEVSQLKLKRQHALDERRALLRLKQEKRQRAKVPAEAPGEITAAIGRAIEGAMEQPGVEGVTRVATPMTSQALPPPPPTLPPPPPTLPLPPPGQWPPGHPLNNSPTERWRSDALGPNYHHPITHPNYTPQLHLATSHPLPPPPPHGHGALLRNQRNPHRHEFAPPQQSAPPPPAYPPRVPPRVPPPPPPARPPAPLGMRESMAAMGLPTSFTSTDWLEAQREAEEEGYT